jgi:hypothetical protein
VLALGTTLRVDGAVTCGAKVDGVALGFMALGVDTAEGAALGLKAFGLVLEGAALGLIELGPVAAGAEPGAGVNTPCASAGVARHATSNGSQRPIGPIPCSSTYLEENAPSGRRLHAPSPFRRGDQVPGRLMVSF